MIDARTGALFAATLDLVGTESIEEWARREPTAWAEVAAVIAFGRPLTPDDRLRGPARRFWLVYTLGMAERPAGWNSGAQDGLPAVGGAA